MDEKIKLIIIVGATATGKSELAVRLAKELGGEIISADSRQIYKGMNIGTGKITAKEMRGIPHHLLGVVSPKTEFNVLKFKKLADKKISGIAKRGKIPFLVGGTGFWIDAVAFDRKFPDVLPNAALRKKLSTKNSRELAEILGKISPKLFKTTDINNKRRLIRAIEIAKARGFKPKQSLQTAYKTLFLGLDFDRSRLYNRIEKRLDVRLRKGMVAEVRRLHHHGLTWKKLENFGLEYKYVSLYLQNEFNQNQMREFLFTAIKQYAKRQKTWFKRNKKIHWLIDMSADESYKHALRIIKEFDKAVISSRPQ